MKAKPAASLQDPKKQTRTYFLIILAFAFLLYGNSIGNGYAFDDNYVTVTNPDQPNNPRVEKGLAGIPEILTSNYIQNNNQSFDYRPLVLITYAIEYQFFKSNPQVSHFVNVLLYALTGMILFILLRRMFAAYSLMFIWMVTFVFMAHPLHTEVVDNLKCRDELLTFLFGLLSVHFCFRYVDKEKWTWLLWAGLALLVALLGKKTALLFAVLIPLTLYFFTELKLKKIVGISAVMAVLCLVYSFLADKAVSTEAPLREYAFFENPLFYERGFFDRLPTVFYVLGYYLRLMIVPYPLVCYYGYNAVPLEDWSSPLSWLSLLIHAGLAIFAVLKLKEKNVFSFCILVYLTGITPFSNINNPVAGIMAERFAYFASLGFCLAAVLLLCRFLRTDIHSKVKDLAAVSPSMQRIVLSLLMVFCFVTIARNANWKDMLTLCEHDANKKEDSYMLQFFAANMLSEKAGSRPPGESERMKAEAKGHYAKAAQLLEEGLKTYDADYHTMSALGTIYVNNLGNVQAGIPWFKRSLAVKPDYEAARYNLIFCYEKMSMPDSALYGYEKLLKEGSSYLPLYYSLHDLYLKKQHYAKAIDMGKKATARYPNEIKLLVNLGNAFIMSADTVSGLKAYEAAATLAPGDYELQMNVSTVFYKVGNTLKGDKYRENAYFLKKGASRR